MVRYANIPGIIGSSDGKENTSAGQWIIRANTMLSSPINVAATNVAKEISNPDLIRKNLKEWPKAAKTAETNMALRGGLEMTAKPIAAIAAINPSISTKRIISLVIIFLTLILTSK